MRPSDATPIFNPKERQRFRDRIVTLCREVAPIDLAGLPLYVLFNSELPEEFQFDHCMAFTGGALDVQFREVIGDQYRGRGPAMVLNDFDSPDIRWPRPRFPQHMMCAKPISIMCYAIHELAHVLQTNPQKTYGVGAIEYSDDMRRDLVDVVRMFTNSPSHPEPRFPFEHHAWRFVLLCSHLTHRLWCGGYAFPSDEFRIFDNDNYGLFDWAAYAGAVRSDALAWRSDSFAEIIARQPTKNFCRLWLQDMELHIGSDAARAAAANAKTEYFFPFEMKARACDERDS